MINTEVQINLSSQVATPIIQAVQGDTGRSVTFVLTDLVIPSGAEATYYVAKPSGECVYNVATISGNIIICDLTAQSLAEVGENNMQVRVLADGKVVTSFEALLMVRAFIGDGAVESSTESTVFDKYFENAKEEFHEAAQEVADQVIETIPEDYTALSNQVGQINERLDDEIADVKEDLPFIDVNSMALMTDVTKLYRYDGSLYFYNGSEWAEVGTGASGDGIILVSLASDMTDTSSVYLYNGTETGYVSGHWYYYDTGTSAWTDGGNYTGWGTIESVLAGMTIEIQTKEIGVLTLTFGDEEYIYDGSSDVSIILADADTTSY